MNHSSSSIEAPSSCRMTGRAFVMTRLSSVAMNIGSPVAMRISASGVRRAEPAGTGVWVVSVADTPASFECLGWRNLGNRMIT